MGNVSACISIDCCIFPIRRSSAHIRVIEMTERYAQVECSKCKKQIPFDDNAILVNGNAIGYLCWKCGKGIIGD